jgi:hypothetical protein
MQFSEIKLCIRSHCDPQKSRYSRIMLTKEAPRHSKFTKRTGANVVSKDLESEWTVCGIPITKRQQRCKNIGGNSRRVQANTRHPLTKPPRNWSPETCLQILPKRCDFSKNRILMPADYISEWYGKIITQYSNFDQYAGEGIRLFTKSCEIVTRS